MPERVENFYHTSQDGFDLLESLDLVNGVKVVGIVAMQLSSQDAPNLHHLDKSVIEDMIIKQQPEEKHALRTLKYF